MADKPAAHVLAERIASAIYEADEEHFDGGCGDVSHLLWRHFTSIGVPCSIEGGQAACTKNKWFTHVWLCLDGERFDPMNVSDKLAVRFYRPAADPSGIIALHTDDSLSDDWEDSYEKVLLSDALAVIATQEMPEPGVGTPSKEGATKIAMSKVCA